VEIDRGGFREMVATSREVVDLARSGQLVEAAALLDDLRREYAHPLLASEAELNALGYEFLYADQLEEAIGVFELQVREYPEAWNAWDSLGEAYLVRADTARARGHYATSLALNPANDNARTILERLQRP
jgi:tetratricopeptide (TPR) repeat protein